MYRKEKVYKDLNELFNTLVKEIRTRSKEQQDIGYRLGYELQVYISALLDGREVEHARGFFCVKKDAKFNHNIKSEIEKYISGLYYND